uniref:Uncharacterized protein n=1 Tax=Anguilla anguilla TaxID=7936 RepID=A0A0E9SL52_ANGAN
MNLVLKVNA